jgi:hypothetical protein
MHGHMNVILADFFLIITQQLCPQSTMTDRKVFAKSSLKPVVCYVDNSLDCAVTLWETNSNYPASHDFTNNQSKLK